MQKKASRIDEPLEGFAYRRDMENFMHRDKIERRIDKAIDEAKAEAKEGPGDVRKDVGSSGV